MCFNNVWRLFASEYICKHGNIMTWCLLVQYLKNRARFCENKSLKYLKKAIKVFPVFTLSLSIPGSEPVVKTWLFLSLQTPWRKDNLFSFQYLYHLSSISHIGKKMHVCQNRQKYNMFKDTRNELGTNNKIQDEHNVNLNLWVSIQISNIQNLNRKAAHLS